MNVPLLDLNAQYEPIIDEIKIEIEKLYSSHHYILGPIVRDFEHEIEKYLDVKHAIGCASGTDAILLSLMAIMILNNSNLEAFADKKKINSVSQAKNQAEIITTPMSFFATASTIVRSGAKPVFVDIDEKTFNIDPELIEEAITENTIAIMPVHLFGQSADMDRILEIAKKYGLYVIEDNAQGIGAKYNNKYAGTIGDIGTLSFFPSKNLGAMGDAGMCLTNNDDIANIIKQLRVHGENPKYFHKYIGLNSRLDSIQAAVLKVKLKYLESWSEARRENAKYYYELLSDISEIELPYVSSFNKHIYNQFTILTKQRDELMIHLNKNYIGCAVYYPLPLHLQECFAYLGGKIGDCPVCEDICKQVLSIPIYSELDIKQIEYIAKKIKKFFKHD